MRPGRYGLNKGPAKLSVAAVCLLAVLLVLPWSAIGNPGRLIGTAGFA